MTCWHLVRIARFADSREGDRNDHHGQFRARRTIRLSNLLRPSATLLNALGVPVRVSARPAPRLYAQPFVSQDVAGDLTCVLCDAGATTFHSRGFRTQKPMCKSFRITAVRF
jgi:hypothetical protein